MTDYAWPSTVIPSGAQWSMRANTASYGSQAIARYGDRWACTLSLPVLPREKAAVMRAFISRLRGHAHRAVLPIHGYTRRGALSFNPRVAGAGQVGLTLAVDNAEANLTNALRAGDYLSVGGRLYMVSADVSSSATGTLSIPLTHPLSVAPTDNATVTVVNPTARFVFLGAAQWQNLPRGNAAVAPLSFLEDIP